METQLSSVDPLAKRRDFLDLRLREGDSRVEVGLAEIGLVEPELLLYDIGETGVEQSLGRRFFKRRRGLFGGVVRLKVGWYLSAIQSGCGMRLSGTFCSTRGTSTWADVEVVVTDQCDFNSVCFVMTGVFSKKLSSDTWPDSDEMSTGTLHESSVSSLSQDGYRHVGRTIGSREYTSSPSSVEDATVLECLCCL